MSHIVNAFTYKSLGLKVLKALLIFTLIFSFSQSAFCSQNHIEKKRKEAHAKVINLKRLESIETNKLYKNQQRLENANKSLNTTNNNTVYTGNDFTGSYSNYVCLFAKVGNAYYQISDRFSMK